MDTNMKYTPWACPLALSSLIPPLFVYPPLVSLLPSSASRAHSGILLQQASLLRFRPDASLPCVLPHPLSSSCRAPTYAAPQHGISPQLIVLRFLCPQPFVSPLLSSASRAHHCAVFQPGVSLLLFVLPYSQLPRRPVHRLLRNSTDSDGKSADGQGRSTHISICCHGVHGRWTYG